MAPPIYSTPVLWSTTRGLFSRGAHPLSRRVVVAASRPVPSSRTPDAKSEVLRRLFNITSTSPPPHTRRARSRP